MLYRFTRYKKTGFALKITALFLFLLFSYGFGRTYIYNLERRYPPFDPTPEQCEQLRGTPIVVLGQGMSEKSDLPVRYQNNSCFERRLFEGIRVAKLIPDSCLIVSMGGDASNSVKQVALDYYIQQFCFPTNRVTMFTMARDTSEEANLAKQLLITQWAVGRGQHPSASTNFSTLELSNFRTNELTHCRTNALILATSASHIPRAIKIFQKQGLSPIASPCDYRFCERESSSEWYMWPLPSGSNFNYSNAAAHEWMGNVYESITDKAN
ncbi:MAG: YdcF family protein [Kiritimatiellae bacterium]|nr:YdcF family protein [Kiritimatiellia bacterium]